MDTVGVADRIQQMNIRHIAKGGEGDIADIRIGMDRKDDPVRGCAMAIRRTARRRVARLRPKFSRRWHVTRTMEVSRASSRTVFEMRSYPRGASSLARKLVSASTMVLPVTWIEAASTPSERKAFAAPGVGAKWTSAMAEM